MKRSAFLRTLESLLRERFSQEFAVLRTEREGGVLLEVWYQEKSAPFQGTPLPLPVMTAQILLEEEPALRLFSFLGAVPQSPRERASIKEALLAWAMEPHTLAKLTLVEEREIMVLFLNASLPLRALREEGLSALLDAFFQDWKRLDALLGGSPDVRGEGFFSA